MSNTRTITVVSTKNGAIKKYETSASTWGEFKSLISSDYDLDNLKPTENINKTTLESEQAILPQSDFRLFLRPDKTKSGGESSELKEVFKKLRKSIEDPSTDIGSFFNTHLVLETCKANDVLRILSAYYVLRNTNNEDFVPSAMNDENYVTDEEKDSILKEMEDLGFND